MTVPGSLYTPIIRKTRGSGHIIEGSGVHTVTGTRSNLTQTFGTTRSSARIFTMSLIIKRVNFGVREGFLYQQANGNSENAGLFEFDASDRLSLKIQQVDSSTIKLQRITTQLFRDPSAWMHIHIAINTGLTTDACCKIHVNGTEITAFDTKTNIDSARDHGFLNSSKELVLLGSTDILTGSATQLQQFAYMSRAIIQDGVYGAPTDVGELTDDGFWQINSASDLTFGNNGFLLEGGTNVTAGYDSSLVATADRPTATVSASSSQFTGATSSVNFSGDDHAFTSTNKSIRSVDTFTGDFEFSCKGGAFPAYARVLVYPIANDSTFNENQQPGAFIIAIDGWGIDLNDGQTYSGGASRAAHGNANGVVVTFKRKGGYISLYYDGVYKTTFPNTSTAELRFVTGIALGSTATISDVNWTDWSATGLPNDFTKTGTITATDDSPTNGGDDDEYGNYAVISEIDVLMSTAAVTLTEGNTKIGTGGGGGRPLTFDLPLTGKYKIELTASGTFSTSAFGVISGTSLWNDANLRRHATQLDQAGSSVQTSLTALAITDVNTMLFDMDSGTYGTVQFKINDVDTGTAQALDADNGAGYKVFVWDASGGCDWKINNGSEGFTYTDTGYLPIATQNLPTPAIINPDDHFHSQIVAKSGTTTTFTLPSWITTYEYLIIIKNISGSAEKWYWLNSLRGVNKYISSNATTAETTDANVYSRSGTTGTLGSTLTSGKSYLIEIHKAGLASATASNTTGSINTIATSANTLSGFSLVEYTGNQTSGATIGHGLSVAPEYLFCKQMNASDGNLDVFHVSLGGTKRLFLQTTAAVNTSAAAWNNTAPTSSVITLGDGYGTNKNTVTYMAYVWHSSSIQSFGSYEGNGNADGSFVNLGFEPGQLFYKDIDVTDQWYNWPKALDTINPRNSALAYNLTNIIIDTVGFDAVSNGAKARTTNAPNTASTYIYGTWGGRPLTDGSTNQGRAK